MCRHRQNHGGGCIRRKPTFSRQRIRVNINDRIRAREIRVIDVDGQQLGIMPPADALKVARAKELDLVEISAAANPPVCRIMNYGKYLYQLKKKAHEAKKHQKMIHVKEVKFRPKTDNHDYEFKKKNILRFLEDGDKVKASVNFRGREMAHKSIGRQLILRLIEDVGEQGAVEGNPKMEGNHMFVIFAGKK